MAPVKTDADLGCCKTPAVLSVMVAGRPGELRGTCSSCGTVWTFRDCTTHGDHVIAHGGAVASKTRIRETL